ncbi:hypothetical protein [Mycobacteroides abscessus]|uniref:hypothetical protein n=1 Tax=Mycobacteroides abscessus TaxID=36809 RepID=UPI0009A7C3ED|nr:hypothetical protein [Mycobacteroides abscessus]SLH42874.1 Uncharacterised protein [Mycobacteroides abscessus subsp. abscessus]
MPSHGSTNDRGYGHEHQQRRANFAKQMKAGTVFPCRRCFLPIKPGQPWDLGHDDNDRDRKSYPEHRHPKHCPMGGNRATAGRRPRTARALDFFNTPPPPEALGA